MKASTHLLTMSEAEWFRRDWSLAELKAQYRDDHLEEMRREHAFYKYWIQRLATLEHSPIERSTLTEIVSNAQWEHVVGEIISQIAQLDLLSQSDAAWLLEVVPTGSWGHDQVTAHLIVSDQTMPWHEKLLKLLNLKSDWAVRKSFVAIPQECFHEAEELIENSPRPKGKRRVLAQELKRVMDRQCQST